MPWSKNQRRGRVGEDKTPWIVEDCESLKGLPNILSVEEVRAGFCIGGVSRGPILEGTFPFLFLKRL
jgi:hypothetical protein